ncbi:MAG: hypothetical protein KF784_13110 [Fimbriimonadaceae bacterium]|nr:hypothetical protein [Fimbriimonadaceae bacterium]
MICLIVAGLLLNPQEVQISYETTGLALGKVVAQLKEQTSLKLSVAANLAEMPMVVSVRDVSPEALLSRIADAAGGQWVINGKDERTLVQTDTVKRRIWNEAVAHREREFTRIQGKIRDILSKQKAITRDRATILITKITQQFNEKSDELRETLEETPTQRLKYNIEAALDSKTVASLHCEESIVYALKPNRLQRPLTPALRAAIDTYIREQRNYVDEILTSGVLSKPEKGEWSGWRWEVDPTGSTQVTVRVERDYGEIRPLTEIEFSKAGKSIIFHRIHGMDAIYLSLRKEQSNSRGRFKEAKKIQLSSDAQAWLDCVDYLEEPLGPVPKSMISVLEKVRRPDLFEPVSLGTGERLVKAAAAEGMQLVIAAPDAFTVYYSYYYRHLTVSSKILEDLIDSIRSLNATLQGNWIVIRPSDLDEGQNPFWANRLRLRNILKSVEARGYATLADLEPLVPPRDSIVDESDVPMLYFRFLCPNAPRELNIGEAFVRRLLKSLPPNILRELDSGRPMQFSSLPLNVQASISSFLYNYSGRGTWLYVSDEDALPYSDDAMEELTEIWPQGLPHQGTLRIEYEEQRGIIIGTSTEGEAPGFKAGSIRDIYLYVSLFEAGNIETKASGYRPMTLLSKRVYFEFPGQEPKYSLIQDQRIDGEWVSRWQDLPEDHRRELEEELKKRQKSRKPPSLLDASKLLSPVYAH